MEYNCAERHQLIERLRYIDGAKEEGKQNPALQQNVIIIFLTQIFLISG